MTAQVWNDFNKELLGFIKSRVSAADEAEDILQEVFIKIHGKIDQLKNKGKLTSWVYQITRNTIIDYYRKSKPQLTELKEVLADEATDDQVPKDFSRCLRPFIESLSADDQQLVFDTTFNGISQKEYAEVHNMPYSTVKSRLQRARLKVKNAFVECCAVEADAYGNIVNSSDNCNC
jgi:RNA polymerase sigma-70 factor (ECF subfamily)